MISLLTLVISTENFLRTPNGVPILKAVQSGPSIRRDLRKRAGDAPFSIPGYYKGVEWGHEGVK